MSAKNKALGRGLSDLGLGELLSSVKVAEKISQTATRAASVATSSERQAQATTTTNSPLRKVALDLLRPNRYQPRQNFPAANLQELADSIKTQGVIQPLLVRAHKGGTFEIIAGERRWRAAKLAGLNEVPVIVKDLSDEQSAAIALIENLQREDLNAIDTAQGLQRLVAEFGMTHEAVAEAVGKSRASVTNLLRLLSLQDAIKQLLQRGELEMGHARALLALPAYQQLAAARAVTQKGLSVRATEELVQRMLNPQKTAPASKISDPNILQLQQKLRDILGAKVIIQHTDKGKSKGRGKVVISYNNLDELDGILAKLKT